MASQPELNLAHIGIMFGVGVVVLSGIVTCLAVGDSFVHSTPDVLWKDIVGGQLFVVAFALIVAFVFALAALGDAKWFEKKRVTA